MNDSPGAGSVPKHETQAFEFLKANPEFDGRGVVVAILDTGVDPGAVGLQVCPDGRPKVIDSIDCSGSGDVDTSTIVKGSDVDFQDGVPTILGLSGRRLKLNPAWKNPSGEWRLGVKRAFELYIKHGLTDRVKKELKKEWDVAHKAAEATAQKRLAEFRQAHPSPSPDDTRQLQNLEDLVAQLSECDKEMDEPGPIFDCVVWNDGGGDGDAPATWYAAVDTSETGDLSEAEAMTDYHVARQSKPFSERDRLNYAVNVYDGGAVLSIVVDAGAHGTHVAGIVAAYHPRTSAGAGTGTGTGGGCDGGGDGERDGVAPGAQIVSLKIGDSRLGSMETGASLTRALIEAVRLKVDIINMSYGEATALPNSGRFVELLDEVVNKHGILFVSSAGNNGPATATVSVPGGTSTSCMGVAAFVSPAMMRAAYSMHAEGAGVGGAYTWSSVGPAADGAWGVSVIAPGGAIAPVPNWTLQKGQLMNGTSMSSPNCCGNVALLLSACKARGLPRSPHRLRRALENTAVPLPGVEPLVQGHGMVQTAAAWRHLVAYAGEKAEDLRFAVSVDGSGSGGARRGVYLRQPGETAAASAWTVRVSPVFHDDAPNMDKAALELSLRLECSAPWVIIPDVLYLMHGGRTFGIKVDPTALSEGLHFCVIRGYDDSASGSGGDDDGPERGPLFEVPITVVKPTPPPPPPAGSAVGAPTPLQMPLAFAPGQVVRSFLAPPPCAWMDFTVRDTRLTTAGTAEASAVAASADAGEPPGPTGTADGTRRLMVLHSMQLLPQSPYREVQKNAYLYLNPGQTEVVSVRVVSQATVEVAIAQYWNASGPGGVTVDMVYRGVVPSTEKVCMHGGSRQAKVLLWSHATLEQVEPSATLTKWLAKITPCSAIVSPLGPRDVLPDGRQIYQLVLEYAFSQAEAGEVTPRLPALNGFLYESAFEHQFHMVFDGSKKLLGSGDAWPGAVKCGKGDHCVRVQVRHDSPEALKALQGMVMHLERSLKGGGCKEVPLSCYATMIDRAMGGKTFPATSLAAGTGTVCFFAEPAHDKLPKAAKPGDVLTGSATYCKAKGSLAGDGKRPGGFPVVYMVGPPPPKEPAAAAAAEPPDARSEAEKMADAVRDLKVSRLVALAATGGGDSFDALYDAEIANYPGHLPLMQTLLAARDAESGRRGRLAAVVAAADAVTAAVDQPELARHFGTNPDPDSPAQTKERKEMQARRDALTDALARKARALADMEAAEAAAAVGTAGTAAAEAAEAGAAAPAAAPAAAAAAVPAAPTEPSAEPATATASPAAPGDSDSKGPALEMGTAAAATAPVAPAAAGANRFMAAFAELQKWDDPSAEKYARLSLAHMRRLGRRGSALKLLAKLLSSQAKVIPRSELLEMRAEIFTELGWAHLSAYDRKWRVLAAPTAYPLF